MTFMAEHETGLPEVPRTALVVTGIYGSGTSALAGTLSILGADLPRDLMSLSSSNKIGQFESYPICKLHDLLLASIGISWNSFLTVSSDWLVSEEARRFEEELFQLALDQFGTSPLFVLKDPRICRLAPIWIRVLARSGAKLAFVHIHRHPMDVAMSLERQNGIETPSGLLLWLRYTLDAEFSTRGQPRYFTSYERLLDDWSGVVCGIKDAFQIRLPRWNADSSGETDNFLSARPRRFHGRSVGDHASRSTDWIRTVHTIFERWAERGEDNQDFAALDEIRSDFNLACEAFAPLVDRSQGGQSHDARPLSRNEKEQVIEGTSSIEFTGREAPEIPDDMGHQTQQRAQEMPAKGAARRLAHERRWEIQQIELAERTLQVHKLERQLQDRFSELGEITRRLMDRETELLRNQVTEIEGQLHTVQRTHKTLQDSHTRMQRTYKALQDAHKALQDAHKALQGAHNKVLASTSWRMIQPLQRVIDTLRH